jgi:hypothetical protein
MSVNLRCGGCGQVYFSGKSSDLDADCDALICWDCVLKEVKMVLANTKAAVGTNAHCACAMKAIATIDAEIAACDKWISMREDNMKPKGAK